MRRVERDATYGIGDVVFWGTPTTAGEYTFIGHPKGERAGKVLVLAHSAEIGFEMDEQMQADRPQQPAARPGVSLALFPQSSGRAGGKSVVG